MIYIVRHGHKAKGRYFNDNMRVLDEPLSGDVLPRVLEKRTGARPRYDVP